MKATVIDNGSANQYAKRKARYGHRYWVMWHDQGDFSKSTRRLVAPVSAEAIKAAMLAHGTQGKFIIYSPDGTSLIIGWGLACVWHKNAKGGHLQ